MISGLFDLDLKQNLLSLNNYDCSYDHPPLKALK